ncbi:hypothetical protein [Thalassospira lucentensis]|uniref:hypothetical protein n=1 Tax=Thalassospira lucentensis TaxID=168935 RepID=UPI0029425C05|nr:hypothetical protein [Thalassospira lucentensis]WOI11846.1 hypothetical protein R1T41_04510 [Thalassospira lucentensis]
MTENQFISPENKEKVEKVLGEPFIEDFSENTFRIRRNLIAISSIVLFYKLGDLTVSKESSFLGVKLDGLTNEKIDIIFICLTSYLLIHFIISTFSHFGEWRVRLSGMKVTYLTSAMFSGEHEDSPANPRQSTLFGYLLQKRDKLESIQTSVDNFQKQLEVWDKSFSDKKDVDNSLKDIVRRLEQIESSLSFLDRIWVSLKRFDRWFCCFQYWQLARWILVEWAVPIILGLWAIYLAICY